MPPNITAPLTRTPLTRSAGRLKNSTAWQISAMSTGPPTTSARNTLRRDHSISPSDRSKMRRDAVRSEGAAGRVVALAEVPVVIVRLLDEILEHGLEVVVRRCDLVNRSQFTAGGQLGEPRVERVGLSRLHDDSSQLEPQAQDVVIGEKPPRERPRVGGPDVHRVGVLVDQIADLVDVAFGQDAAVVD